MNAALIDEIITLKTVGRLSPAEIARRCGVQIAEVADVLIDAGILILKPASQALREESLRDIRSYWRNSAESRAERQAERGVAPPADPDNPHLDHCLRVIRALGGRGFPFLALPSA